MSLFPTPPANSSSFWSRITATAFLLSVSLLHLGCSKSEPEKTEEKTQPAAQERGADGTRGPGAANRREADPIPVQVAAVTRGPIAASLAFNSTLETESIVDIYPRINGQVDQLLVEEGDIVTAGTPLLKIDDRELRVDADEARVALEREQSDFTRTEELFKRGLVNEQQFETDRLRPRPS